MVGKGVIWKPDATQIQQAILDASKRSGRRSGLCRAQLAISRIGAAGGGGAASGGASEAVRPTASAGRRSGTGAAAGHQLAAARQPGSSATPLRYRWYPAARLAERLRSRR